MIIYGNDTYAILLRAVMYLLRAPLWDISHRAWLVSVQAALIGFHSAVKAYKCTKLLMRWPLLKETTSESVCKTV